MKINLQKIQFSSSNLRYVIMIADSFIFGEEMNFLAFIFQNSWLSERINCISCVGFAVRWIQKIVPFLWIVSVTFLEYGSDVIFKSLESYERYRSQKKLFRALYSRIDTNQPSLKTYIYRSKTKKKYFQIKINIYFVGVCIYEWYSTQKPTLLQLVEGKS